MKQMEIMGFFVIALILQFLLSPGVDLTGLSFRGAIMESRGHNTIKRHKFSIAQIVALSLFSFAIFYCIVNSIGHRDWYEFYRDYSICENDLVFSPDGRYLSVQSTRYFLLWDIKNTRLIHSEKKKYTGSGPEYRYSPDSRYLVVFRSFYFPEVFDIMNCSIVYSPVKEEGFFGEFSPFNELTAIRYQEPNGFVLTQMNVSDKKLNKVTLKSIADKPTDTTFAFLNKPVGGCYIVLLYFTRKGEITFLQAELYDHKHDLIVDKLELYWEEKSEESTDSKPLFTSDSLDNHYRIGGDRVFVFTPDGYLNFLDFGKSQVIKTTIRREDWSLFNTSRDGEVCAFLPRNTEVQNKSVIPGNHKVKEQVHVFRTETWHNQSIISLGSRLDTRSLAICNVNNCIAFEKTTGVHGVNKDMKIVLLNFQSADEDIKVFSVRNNCFTRK